MSNPPPPPFQPPYPPQPVQPLGYAPPQGAGRPGIITAVGVISIIMAILSLFGAIGALFTAVWMQIMPGFMRVAAAATTMPATAPAGGAPPPNPFTNFQWDIPMLIVASVDGLLRLGLAILLGIAGIMVLRDARSGRKLHLIWAWLRIPVALVGAYVYYQMMNSMMASVQASMPTPPAGGPAVTPTAIASTFGTVFEFALSCAYPVAVLIVMHTKKVKGFYLTLGK